MKMEIGNRLFEDEQQIEHYAKFRPSPPSSLIKKLLDAVHPNEYDVAVDVGCGSGQVTFELAKHFRNVIGIDVSRAQIREADGIKTETSSTNVQFRVGTDESLEDFEPKSVTLVTVCQAIHWFPDISEFYQRVKRILKPGGVLAVFGYQYSRPGPTMESSRILCEIQEKYRKSLIWSPLNDHLATKYKKIPEIPFASVERDESGYFEDKTWDLKSYVGYHRSWSGYANYQAQFGDLGAQKILQTLENETKEVLNGMQHNAARIPEVSLQDKQVDSQEKPQKCRISRKVGDENEDCESNVTIVVRTEYFLLLGRT